jgi:hypothetical protein
MNVFQLGIISSPLVGAVVGGAAVASRNPADVALGTIAGFIIGAASYIVPVLFAGALFTCIAGSQTMERPSVFEWGVGLIVVLCAASAPFLAGVSSWWAVKAVLAASIPHCWCHSFDSSHSWVSFLVI